MSRQINSLQIIRINYTHGIDYKSFLSDYFYINVGPSELLPWNNGNNFLNEMLQTDKLDKHYQHIITSTIFLLK